MSNKKKLKILLVEDRAAIVEQIIDVLATLSCIEEVRTATSSKEALRFIEQFWPNVVITDLRLQQGNGFEVLKAIKEMNFKPVRIVLTNHSISNYRQYAELLGMDYFLDKAKDLDSLCGLVETIHRTGKHLELTR
jgi:two-component system, response regulator YesN